MSESSEYRPPSKKKKEKSPQPKKNNTPLPQNMSRRKFLIGAGAAATALAIGGATVINQFSPEEQVPAEPTIELLMPSKDGSNVEQYLQITTKLKELESKYKPNEMPNVHDPEFVKDAQNTLKLAYSMCNFAIPEWASATAYNDSQICYTPEEFAQEAAVIDPSGNLASILKNRAGAITYGGNDRRIIYNTFDPNVVTSYGRYGLGVLSYLRTVAVHERGHYINKLRVLPQEQIFTMGGVEFSSTNGAEFSTGIPVDASPQIEMLTGLNEILTDEEMIGIQKNAGLLTIDAGIYHEFADKMDELYTLVGQNRADHNQTLFDLRKEGDPVGIIDHFSQFVNKAPDLPINERIRWGVATIGFALNGMNTERDILLREPTAINQMAMVPPAQMGYAI